MATIQVTRDDIQSRVWWLKWLEQDDIVGRVVHDADGLYKIFPSGPHWGPMKSFAGFSSRTLDDAVAEVALYFEHR